MSKPKAKKMTASLYLCISYGLMHGDNALMSDDIIDSIEQQYKKKGSNRFTFGTASRKSKHSFFYSAQRLNLGDILSRWRGGIQATMTQTYKHGYIEMMVVEEDIYNVLCNKLDEMESLGKDYDKTKTKTKTKTKETQDYPKMYPCIAATEAKANEAQENQEKANKTKYYQLRLHKDNNTAPTLTQVKDKSEIERIKQNFLKQENIANLQLNVDNRSIRVTNSYNTTKSNNITDSSTTTNNKNRINNKNLHDSRNKRTDQHNREHTQMNTKNARRNRISYEHGDMNMQHNTISDSAQVSNLMSSGAGARNQMVTRSINTLSPQKQRKDKPKTKSKSKSKNKNKNKRRDKDDDEDSDLDENPNENQNRKRKRKEKIEDSNDEDDGDEHGHGGGDDQDDDQDEDEDENEDEDQDQDGDGDGDGDGADEQNVDDDDEEEEEEDIDIVEYMKKQSQ